VLIWERDALGRRKGFDLGGKEPSLELRRNASVTLLLIIYRKRGGGRNIGGKKGKMFGEERGTPSEKRKGRVNTKGELFETV